MRLDKYISNATDLSRTDVKKLIKSGLVSIDDETAKSGSQKVTDDQKVAIEGSTIQLMTTRYFMMNKPAGVVSATKDHTNPTALDLIYEHRNDQLQIAGRLDIDTTGLLLITDDGQWNHIVTSPRTDCKKIYAVELENAVSEDYHKRPCPQGQAARPTAHRAGVGARAATVRRGGNRGQCPGYDRSEITRQGAKIARLDAGRG